MPILVYGLVVKKIEKWPKFKIDLVTFGSHTPSGYPGGVHYTVALTVFFDQSEPYFIGLWITVDKRAMNHVMKMCLEVAQHTP